MIHQSLIKQTVPLACFLFYLIVKEKRNDDLCIPMLAYFSPFVYVTLALSELNPLTLVDYTWRTHASPLQYIVYLLVIYHYSYTRWFNPYYSLALATNTAALAGYLYEVPRYLRLQGLMGLIRFNQHSLIKIDYAIVSIFTVLYLIKTRKEIILNTKALILYSIYFLAYYFFTDNLYYVKQNLAWIYSIRVPWIVLYRLPAMILIFTLCFHDHFNEDKEADETVRDI